MTTNRKTIFYNVQHSPIGAFASFTLGCKGAKGGLGLELTRPAEENVFIGVETRGGGHFEALPFFAGAESEAARYDVERAKTDTEVPNRLSAFPDRAIRRELTPYSDIWRAGDLTCRVFSPVFSVPDPRTGETEALRRALVPAVLVELTIDNRRGKRERTAFFGYTGSSPYANMRRLSDAGDTLAGVGNGLRTALCAVPEGITEGIGFSILDILQPKAGLPDNRVHGLGGTGALLFSVGPGELRTVRAAVAFHVAGLATSGMPATYAYSRFFPTIESAGAYALEHFDAIVRASAKTVATWKLETLTPDQCFMLAHAVHSYYGSTQFLDAGKHTPFWVVNEGEYRMMNTFDLTADQVFFELLMNPWTVRNELDWYAKRYSYRDRVRFPGEAKTYPGGLAFTHDMGIGNVVSRPGFSSYEMVGLDGCFSHMTHEELVNWVCCGALYAFRADDRTWRRRNLARFKDCFASMLNRDHPDPEQRNGIMALDSDRCQGGAEITTYDSLDQSLGQARNNLYLAVKCWSAYVLLAELFPSGSPEREDARLQARRAAGTIAASADAEGRLPAVLHEGVDSRIIPAIEGLAFPYFAGFPALVSETGPYGTLVGALKRHLAAVLKPGCCLFDDGGWKLSSTSDNSWLSKIYLCQFVAREVLDMAWNAKGRKADAAHVGWLLHPESLYWAWSDQMISGVAVGSKYYPRGVTAILWTLPGTGALENGFCKQ